MLRALGVADRGQRGVRAHRHAEADAAEAHARGAILPERTKPSGTATGAMTTSRTSAGVAAPGGLLRVCPVTSGDARERLRTSLAPLARPTPAKRAR